MNIDPIDQERMNNFMLKGVFMTDKELEEGARWFNGPRMAIAVVIAFLLGILTIIGHA